MKSLILILALITLTTAQSDWKCKLKKPEQNKNKIFFFFLKKKHFFSISKKITQQKNTQCIIYLNQSMYMHLIF